MRQILRGWVLAADWDGAETMPRVMSLVNSSVIRAMGYDAEARVLAIVFREGRGRYRYFDVPAEVWAAFQAAESKGTYLNETFKEMGFGYEKL